MILLAFPSWGVCYDAEFSHVTPQDTMDKMPDSNRYANCYEAVDVAANDNESLTSNFYSL